MYDVVINPSILEPVVQIGMNIKLQFTPKPKEKKEGQGEVQEDKKIDESNLKDKNLKVLKSKRDVDVGGVKPGKKFKKKNRKK